MSRLPRATGAEVVVVLRRAGFEVVRITGSHNHLRKAGHPGIVTVPVHAGKVLRPSTLRSVLRQAGMTVDDFTALL